MNCDYWIDWLTIMLILILYFLYIPCNPSPESINTCDPANGKYIFTMSWIHSIRLNDRLQILHVWRRISRTAPLFCLTARHRHACLTSSGYTTVSIVPWYACMPDVSVSLCVLVPAGYGFVDFDSPASAQKAVTALKAGGVQAQMAKVGLPRREVGRRFRSTLSLGIENANCWRHERELNEPSGLSFEFIAS